MWLLALDTACTSCCTEDREHDLIFRKTAALSFLDLLSPKLFLKCWMCKQGVVQGTAGKNNTEAVCICASKTARRIDLKLPKDYFSSTHGIRAWDSRGSTVTKQGKTWPKILRWFVACLKQITSLERVYDN